MRRNPLSPFVYFSRNPSKVLPMGLVIVLSVFLIASVATMVDSIDLTIQTMYAYTKSFTYVVPQRVTQKVPADQIAIIKNDPRVDRVMESSAFFTSVKTVFGRFPFIVIGVSDQDRAYLMQRVGTSLLPGGRMPADGMPEAVLSEPIAENKKVKIGDIIAGPDDQGGVSGSPVPVRLVGILRGPIWIAFTSKSFCDSTFLYSPKTTVFTAKSEKDLFAMNVDLLPEANKSRGRLNSAKVQLFSYQNLVHDLRDSLSSMYLIMGVVNGMVIFVIALMSGMLANIYFTQRLPEFAVLAAIGYQRATLIWRIIGETLLLTVAGWLAGGVVTVIGLTLMKSTLFEPRGLIINPHDLFAYEYTLPIPFCLTIFAVATIAVRLVRLDPVTIIERR